MTTPHMQYPRTVEGWVAYQVHGPELAASREQVVTVLGMGDLRSSYRFVVPVLVDAAAGTGPGGTSRGGRTCHGPTRGTVSPPSAAATFSDISRAATSPGTGQPRAARTCAVSPGLGYPAVVGCWSMGGHPHPPGPHRGRAVGEEGQDGDSHRSRTGELRRHPSQPAPGHQSRRLNWYRSRAVVKFPV